jgi:transposase
VKAALINSKYALLKPEKNLTDNQKLKLDEIKKALPRLAEMHQQKEALRDIFETAKSGTDGMLKIAAWMKKSQEIFKVDGLAKLLTTLNREQQVVLLKG